MPIYPNIEITKKGALGHWTSSRNLKPKAQRPESLRPQTPLLLALVVTRVVIISLVVLVSMKRESDYSRVTVLVLARVMLLLLV